MPGFPPRFPRARAGVHGMRVSGFTLVELVMVMLIIGVLAATAIPRFFSRSGFEGRAFFDETLAVLRFAQKTAIAQRRNVCVTFGSSPSSATLTIASAAGAASPCNTNLTGPTGGAPYTLTARTGVAYSSTPTNFQFYAQGQASVGQTIQVSGVSGTITVELGTGYVHP